MSWKETWLEWIDTQKQNNPNMTREELRKHCSKNVPLYERKGWEYKAFLSAMHQKFGRNMTNKKQINMF